MAWYYQKRGINQDDEEEISEEMQMIEDKVREMTDFNARNFKVDRQLVEMMGDIYDELDNEMVCAPFVEYTEDNPPPYLPDPSKWVNDIVYSSSNKHIDSSEREEL